MSTQSINLNKIQEIFPFDYIKSYQDKMSDFLEK